MYLAPHPKRSVIMRKRNTIIALLLITTILGSYIAYCLRCYYLPPPIASQLADPIPDEARQVIEDWRQNSGLIVSPGMDSQGVWHAVTHPYNPNDIRCVLCIYIEDEEVGLFYRSVEGPRMAIFRKTESGWAYWHSDDMTGWNLDYSY